MFQVRTDQEKNLLKIACLHLMSFFHYRRGTRLVTCETMDEAMAALAG